MYTRHVDQVTSATRRAGTGSTSTRYWSNRHHVNQVTSDTQRGQRLVRVRRNRAGHLAGRSMHTADSRITDIVAIAVYKANRHTHCDQVLLEERVTPALRCGSACGTIGFPGGKVEEADRGSLRIAMQRELREELMFSDRGVAHEVLLTGPVGRVELGPFRISLFTTRIPSTAKVECTTEYRQRVQALHWRRPSAIRGDTESRLMPSTRLLLDLVPSPPPDPHDTKKAGTVCVDLPSSGRAPRQPAAPRKRKRATRSE